MAKMCPLSGEKVIYLCCMECDSRRECKSGKLKRRSNSGEDNGIADLSQGSGEPKN